MITKKNLGFLLISLISVLISVLGNYHSIFSSIENRSWDFRLGLTAGGKQAADSNIKLIIVDQASLNSYAANEGITWPWPRTMYVPVLRYLQAAGAKGVAFDLIFSEGSIHGVEEDVEFASELEAKMPIVSAVAPAISNVYSTSKEDFDIFKKRQSEENSRTQFFSRYSLDLSGIDFHSATLPVREILEKSPVFGSTWVAPDDDGIFRHYRSGGDIDGVPILSLAFSLFNAGSESSQSTDKILSSELFDLEGRLTVKFNGGQGTYQTIPIADVISSYVDKFESEDNQNKQPIIPLETFKDAWVFIGVWAPGLLDLRPTPLDEVYKGVEYHATVLDNLIHSKFVVEVRPFLNNAYSAFFVLLITLSAFFVNKERAQLILFILIALSFSYSGYVLAENGYWIKMIVPLFSMIIALLASLIFQYYLEGRERRFIKNAFSRYVSPELIKKIIADPRSLSLGGEKRELTIFFSDIAGFTAVSESLPADQLVSLLNHYLTEMTDIILASGATLDKYEGDAIIAFWNAPINIEDHPYKAVKAALDCQKRLKELRPQFETQYGVDMHMRIGLHTGLVNVGNFGSRERFDYTVIGDTANLAARLEGVNKVFGTYILISEQTKELLGDRIPCRKLGTIRVVGRKQGIDVYEPLADGQMGVEEFQACLKQYEDKELELALSGFSKLNKDPVAKTYLVRIAQELQSGNLDEWSHVWNLSSK